MAVLALAAGGALFGSAVAGSVGASVGWALGGLVGQFLFGGKQQGPQLGDLTVQSSAYGTPIPLLFGTARMAGNVIWTSGIQRRKRRSRLGKGGGRQTTYTHDCSFAVAFCEGPGVRLVKLWFDDKLGYDATGGSLQIRVPGLRFRFYGGDETQLPDPLIAASAPSGQAPAYRGTAYIVFERLPLDEFGARLPNVTALLATDVASANNDVALNIVTGGYQPDGAVDFSTRRAYWRADSGVVEIDYAANSSRLVPGTAGRFGPKWAVLPGGPLVGQISEGSGANTRPVAAIDPISGAELWRFGSFGTGLVQTATGGIVAAGSAAASCEVLGSLRRRFVLLESREISARPMPLCLDADTGEHIFGAETSGVARLYEPRGGSAGKYVQGEQRVGETDMWHVSPASSPAEIEIWRLRFSAAARWFGSPALRTEGVIATRAAVLQASDLGFTSGGTPVILALAYDSADNGLIIVASWPASPSPNPQRFVVKWTPDSGVVWRTSGHNGNIPAGGSEMNGTFLVRGRFAYAGDTGTGIVLDSRTGAIEQQGTLTSHGTIAAPRTFFDGDYDLLVSWTRRLLLGRLTPGTVALSGIVQAICGRAGLAPSDLSLASLTDQVRGYVVSRPGSARDALAPLSAAFLFDMVETDGQLRAVKRGGGVAATLTYGELLRDGERGVLVEERAPDLELPRALTVRYIDVGRAYEPSAQTWQRPAAPTEVSGAAGRIDVDIAVPMTAAEARTLARRLLMAAWRERTRVVFAGTPRHLRFDPADVLTLTRADGTTRRVRLTRADLGADWTLRCEAVAEDPADYALTATGDAGSYLENGMPVPYVTRGFALNLPLLEDGDDLNGGGFREYLMAGGYGSGWRGVEVAQSDDRNTWDALDPLTDGVAWGAAANALAAPASPWTWDDANTLTVWMAAGAPESATDLEVLNGANLAALVNPLTGTLEMIQWATATANSDGSFALSRLLRGRRGTEDGCANRAAGDQFVILSPDTRLPLITAPALLSATRFYRLRGRFDAPEAATIVAKALRGRAERPYAPVLIAGSRDGSNNLTITWQRRTRVGGELRDYTDQVPVAEASEGYELELLNGMTLVRTLTGLTARTASYTAAQQTADGITPGNPVGVRVYQMSALVGRGTPGSATV